MKRSRTWVDQQRSKDEEREGAREGGRVYKDELMVVSRYDIASRQKLAF
jgi:hypothetical protein